MTEADKELRLSLISGWRDQLRLSAADIEGAELEIRTAKAHLEMLEQRLRLFRLRAEYAALCLRALGVRQL